MNSIRKLFSKSHLRKLGRDAQGANMMEYIVIAVLVGTLLIALFVTFGNKLGKALEQTNTELNELDLSARGGS